MDDPEIAAALGDGPAEDLPFEDFLQDFYNDPDKPLKFLRSYMAGEDSYNPAVDVVEDQHKFTVIADLPGVSEKDLKVEFVEGGMVLRGRREPAFEPAGGRLRRAERPGGEFVKSVPLPEGLDVQKVAANMQNGVFTLTIPRGEPAGNGRDRKALKAETP